MNMKCISCFLIRLAKSLIEHPVTASIKLIKNFTIIIWPDIGACFEAMVARSFILLFTLVALCCSRDLKQEYRFSSRLDGENYVLYWKFDYQMKNITFAVSVKTTGWVGFGLSPNGQMPLSDVVTGWVDNNGRAMLQVRLYAKFAKTSLFVGPLCRHTSHASNRPSAKLVSDKRR